MWGKMARKRDRLEVIFNILKIIAEHKNSIKPTPLLRFSNLSSVSFNEYINELSSKGFVKLERDKKGKKFYTITDKGYSYVEKYSTIVGFIEEFEL